MIFNLVKKAKDIFINKANTGVEAENVEDAIKVLNSNLDNIKLRVGYLTYDGAEGDNLRANLPVTFTFNNTYYATADITIPEGYEIHPNYPTIQATINSSSISNSPCISSINRYHATALIIYLNQSYTGNLSVAIGVRLKKTS